ncbi:FAD dependent oxidoreductase [Dendrothele bispora CBS 962.96]|uniref:FAD dependent oxidoreductase n=1 Tax=Dendrothele bispora (strain CBS 962.96) TaxID=1314807 RepID=A0A4S8M4H3_DENBC|nr:FAD dependent oxidoreductase [Dendrothele bispora CBS 962.96]
MSSTNNLPINDELDALVVGAGFSGLYQLYQLRKLGSSVKLFESGSDVGGVWYWNCYPGARVDSETPSYEFSLPELWKDWRWTQRFPDRNELHSYLQYVGEKLDLKKDIVFNTRVTAARFDPDTDRWTVTTEQGTIVRPRFLVLAVGSASKPYIPNLPGLVNFQGIVHHTANWPQGGVDMEGKRVGVIGTGSTGVQVISEIGPKVKHLTVFQRLPAIVLPQINSKVDDEKHARMRELSPLIYRHRKQTASGHTVHSFPLDTFSVSSEERQLLWEELWSRGGLNFCGDNFKDMMINQEANDEVYAFWRNKILAKFDDPVMQKKLAPQVAPYPFAAKKPVMDDNYYKVLSQTNVDLVDVRKTPIQEITDKGILTSDGVEYEVDILVIACGFDGATGGITQIDIRGLDGASIKDKWTKGVYTNLGMTTANFPNMFIVYGPQSPSILSNAPTTIEIQCAWITTCIEYLKNNRLTRIEATREAEDKWRDLTMSVAGGTLVSKAESWWNGANIPGKAVEPLYFAGGIPYYASILREQEKNGYPNFTLSTHGQTAATIDSENKYTTSQ